MKNKKINFFVLIWFVFIQLLYPVQIVLAIEKNNNFTIEDKDVNNGLFSIHLDNTVDYDEIVLELPDEVSYDLPNNIKHDYNKTNNEIKINRKNISSDSFDIQLTNLSNGENEFYLKVFNKKSQIEQKVHRFDVSETQSFSLEDKKEEYSQLNEYDIFKNSENSITAPDLQRDISIEAVNKTTHSGDAAVYKLSMKVTGSQLYYNNVILSIQLPKNEHTSFNQPLDELIIEGVKPTYDEETRKLDYYFEKVVSGQTYEKLIRVDTENGYIPNGTELRTEANLKFETNSDKLDQITNDTVIIKASWDVSITKKLESSQLANMESVPTLGGALKWSIKVSFGYKETNQMFLKPGSEIIIKDVLPKGLIYDSSRLIGNTGKAQIGSNGELIWRFKVPSINEQLNNKNLFDKTIEFWTKVSDESKYIDKTLVNKANVSGTFIDNKYIDSIDSDKYEVPIQNPTGNDQSPPGSIILPTHAGPANGEGKKGSTSKSDNPTVYPDAYLQFAFVVFPYKTGLRHPMEALVWTYYVDDNLILEEFSPPNKKWRKGAYSSEYWNNNYVSLDGSVKYLYRFHFVDKDGVEQPPVDFKDFEEGEKYNLENIGLNKGDKVTKIEQIFEAPVPARMGNDTSTQLFFSIKKGYIGEVKNTLNVTGRSSYNPSNGGYSKGKTQYNFNWQKLFPELFEGSTNHLGPRTAQVVSMPKQSAPIAEVNVKFLEEDKGIVQDGKNRLSVSLTNNISSNSSMTGPLESVVILPPGVSVSDNPDVVLRNATGAKTNGKFEIMDKNYNNTGRQRVKFIWNEEFLRKGKNVTAEVNVLISKSAPSSLYMDVYGFSKDSKIDVPKTTEDSLTTTILQKEDIDDLNGDKDIKQPRIKSSNMYQLLSMYDLKTEKFVKGPGEEWSKFAKTTPGGKIDYRLFLTNSTGKDISSMTLIDVLPAGGDLGITDNISRGSKFMPYLSGKINLPKEWQGKVKVYYSTSKNPKRDDLIRHTNYPNDTTPLGNPNGATDPKWMSEDTVKDWTSIRSFKIELIPGAVWIKGVDMNITFNMEAPTVERASNKGIFNPKVDPQERAAWNSFAVATDNGQPVEPQQVGVYIDKDIGQLQIKKVDSETGNVLSGAEFKISSEDGSFVKTMVSNEEGIAELKDIPLGKYTIMETKAPNGYNLSQEKVNIEVTNDTYDHQITIKNQRIKGNITIKKVDSITGKTLSSAVFEIKNSKGDVIKTLTTDDKGLANISDLSDGKYTITEIKAPDGYNLLQKSIDVEVNSKDSNVTVTVKNTAIGWELPETGGSGMLLFSVIGLLFMSVGFSFMRIRRY